LWEVYLYLGGSLELEPDTQSPFFDPEAAIERGYERPGLRVLRRPGLAATRITPYSQSHAQISY
jgi:hypothetical protein